MFAKTFIRAESVVTVGIVVAAVQLFRTLINICNENHHVKSK